jgi:hypothetical protein
MRMARRSPSTPAHASIRSTAGCVTTPPVVHIGVPYLDKDFDLIAGVTGQPAESLRL